MIPRAQLAGGVGDEGVGDLGSIADGAARLVVRRETPEDLLRLDV